MCVCVCGIPPTCEASVGDVEHEPLLAGFPLLFTHIQHGQSAFSGVLSILKSARFLRFHAVFILLLICGGKSRQRHEHESCVGTSS